MLNRVGSKKSSKVRRPLKVKFSKSQTYSRVHKVPEIKFEDQSLTSFAGLAVFMPLLRRLGLKERLGRCFPRRKGSPIYAAATIALGLIIHIIIGFHRLRDVEYYGDDPMVKRLLGLKRLPSAATISRSLREMDAGDYERVRELSRELVCDRIRLNSPARLTLDFDGVVFSTSGRPEGSAVGMNKKKKGARSYYPLFCTVAQTSQVFDALHRPGNVHDSNGAGEFMSGCVAEVRSAAPSAVIEGRIDSAFFSRQTAVMLDAENVEFTISAPFARFAELKQMIAERRRWLRLDAEWSYFESEWKPKSWDEKFRFIFIRKRVKLQDKKPVQLDLFEPHDYGYEYKVIVTNKTACARKVLRFHNGRGAQEALFGEARSHARFDYIPTRKLAGNRVWMTCGIMAHNLVRELQMQSKPPARGTTEKRSPLWTFEHLGTLRHRLLQRAGRITHPGGKLTLTLSGNPAVRREMLALLDALGAEEARKAA